MKYKVGDKVRVKSKEFFESIKDIYHTYKDPSKKSPVEFVPEMKQHCGRIVKILNSNECYYKVVESTYSFADWMLEDGYLTAHVVKHTIQRRKFSKVSPTIY